MTVCVSCADHNLLATIFFLSAFLCLVSRLLTGIFLRKEKCALRLGQRRERERIPSRKRREPKEINKTFLKLQSPIQREWDGIHTVKKEKKRKSIMESIFFSHVNESVPVADLTKLDHYSLNPHLQKKIHIIISEIETSSHARRTYSFF